MYRRGRRCGKRHRLYSFPDSRGASSTSSEDSDFSSSQSKVASIRETGISGFAAGRARTDLETSRSTWSLKFFLRIRQCFVSSRRKLCYWFSSFPRDGFLYADVEFAQRGPDKTLFAGALLSLQRKFRYTQYCCWATFKKGWVYIVHPASL